MKILLTLFVLFFTSSVFSETFYCSENNAVGFDGRNNYKQVDIEPIKFEAVIDFRNFKFIANDIYIDSNDICLDGKNNTMRCSNGIGTSIIINKQNFNFVYSSGFGHVHNKINEDDLIFSYGRCYKN
tara:strand:+ start:546 stop:926 length:381 start_codon:yes stop_codon:yes gene_type:complete